MDALVAELNRWMGLANDVLWHDVALYAVLGAGILFTVWSGFCQWRALTHGVAVIRGRYDRKDDPGAINHFQALSAALSATVGIGNIGGVALAIALGGPGAIFWMWVVGFVGMALKTVEVTLAMLYRDTSHAGEPHGGPMWVADRGLSQISPRLKPLGKFLAVVFCITLLISTITGGNMFQAWNVAAVSSTNFGIPDWITGLVLTVLCGLVIIGGIKRIGQVAGALVPFMCIIYLLAAAYVLVVHFRDIPEMISLIFRGAFSPLEGERAFLGGTAGYAFLWGMKRALFSNEAGQGSSPIAHSAARTDEPAREGIVAGLEPFIDTIVVCTLTSLVILASGAWNREPEAFLLEPPEIVAAGTAGKWTVKTHPLPPRHNGNSWREGDTVFVILRAQDNAQTGTNRHRLGGTVKVNGTDFVVEWDEHESPEKPTHDGAGVYVDYVGASLTSYAFDRVLPGLGRWIVTLAVWLFALSTVISWSYYGEQGSVYLFGERSIMTYRIIYCLFIFVTCLGYIKTETELDNLSALGTGIMLFANMPICLIFAYQAMKTNRDYLRRLDAGEFDHPRRGGQV